MRFLSYLSDRGPTFGLEQFIGSALVTMKSNLLLVRFFASFYVDVYYSVELKVGLSLPSIGLDLEIIQILCPPAKNGRRKGRRQTFLKNSADNIILGSRGRAGKCQNFRSESENTL